MLKFNRSKTVATPNSKETKTQKGTRATSKTTSTKKKTDKKSKKSKKSKKTTSKNDKNTQKFNDIVNDNQQKYNENNTNNNNNTQHVRDVTTIMIDDLDIEKETSFNGIEMNNKSNVKTNNTKTNDKNDNTTKNNDDIMVSNSCWSKIPERKRPYIILINLGILLVILLFVYIYNPLYLVNGLITNIISILLLLPVLYIFKYYENLIDKWKNEFYGVEKINSNLEKELIEKKSRNTELSKEVLALKMSIADTKVQFENLKNSKNSDLLKKSTIEMFNKKLTLLEGFREGLMEMQLELADKYDLTNMLPVVCSSIALIPFGMTRLRSRLLSILNSKILKDDFLKQSFHCFLMSYYECLDVKRLFRHHKVMKHVRQTSHVIYGNTRNRLLSETSINTISPTSSPRFNMTDSNNNRNLVELNDTLSKVEKTNKSLQIIKENNKQYGRSSNSNNKVNSLIYDQSDPVTLFRKIWEVNANIGFTLIVHPKYESKFYDPINGNNNVAQLKVIKIFNSNAKPYLVECYCLNKSINKTYLSSTFILKQGDDLRRDECVLLMFKFMNKLWYDNRLQLNNQLVEALTYNIVPMGNDFGVLELIPNCINLNKINNIKKNLQSNDKLLCKLVASAAGSFIAAFVMGIRDRHDDNVLLRTTDCTMFHIDFGYMLGEEVSGIDTNKLAITNNLKQTMGNRWKDFINISTRAYLILRQNHKELIDYARVVFTFIYPINKVEEFIRDTLKCDLDTNDALKYIQSKLEKAPKGVKTKMKNFVHGIAQKIKS